MLIRAFIMAASPKPKGNPIGLPKGGHRWREASPALETKPPSGRAIGASQSERSLATGTTPVKMRDSHRNLLSSQSGQMGSRGFFSGSRRALNIKSVEDVAAMLKEDAVRNVVIVAGAGISTPSGIPDFRSPGTGLYDNLKQFSIPYAEAIFDIDYFHYNPRPFFTLAKELYPCGKYRPNYMHYFAKLLYDRGLLLRMYTQNIDGLERIAGIPADKMVEAHGTFSSATCVRCRMKYDGDEIKEKIFQNKLPKCSRVNCDGIVKPDIVFFGEELPKRFYFYLKDMLQADLVFIMGTSLEVEPFAGIIDTVRFTVPRVLFNRKAVGPFKKRKRPKDFVAEGDLIHQLEHFVAMAGFTQDMVTLITRKEGYFKTAFPPPIISRNAGGDKKTEKPVLPNPLATMWRRNAQINLYSDSESTETDSGVTPSDSDTSSDSEEERRKRRQRRKNIRQAFASPPKNPIRKVSHDNTTSSTRGGSVSKSSSLNSQSKASKSRQVLHPHGDGRGPVRSFTQLAPNRLRDDSNHRSKPPRDASSHKLSGSKESQKPPPAPRPAPRTHVSRRAHHGPVSVQSRVEVGVLPSAHPVKPRSNSVTKAVPERLHTKASDNLKTMYSRINSATPAKLAFRHKLQPSGYVTAVSSCPSDSTSSEDIDEADHDSDSSDDS